MKEELIYWEPSKLSKERILTILNSNNVHDIEEALISLTFHDDLRFAAEIIFKCVKIDIEEIKGTAILCVGHLARIHGVLPEKETIQIIIEGLQNNSSYIKEQTETALDDIDVFLPELGKKIHRKLKG